MTFLFLIILAAQSDVYARTVKLQENSRIGVVNLVGEKTKIMYWDFTAFSNFYEELTVGWNIRGYIDDGILLERDRYFCHQAQHSHLSRWFTKDD